MMIRITPKSGSVASLLVLSALALAAPRAASAAAAPARAPVEFYQLPIPRQTIFNGAADPCPIQYFPDGPPRPFRRADGRISLVNNENDDFQLVGDNPFDLRVVCKPILSSAQYGSLVRGQVGIGAVYTEDGNTVYALAGQDLSALNMALGCTDQFNGNCWQGGVSLLVSKDMGNDYAFTSSGNNDVAALTHTLTTTQPSTEGYTGVSNIVKRNGLYYAFFTPINAYAGGQSHTCLARTADLADPTSWRAFDGSGFNASLQPAGNGPSPIPCADIGGGNIAGISSLSYIPRKGLYIAVTQARLQLAGDAAPVPGAYYSTSPDLFGWSPVKRLMYLPHLGTDSMTESDNYPALVDPFSRTRNFETIDSATPVLLYVLEHLDQGRGTLDRDVVAVPLLMP